MNALKRSFNELRRYPSAVVGVALIGVIVAIALYAVIAIPYDEAIRLWRGGEDVWLETPRHARPKWVNLFRSEKLPETIIVRTSDSPDSKTVVPYGGGFSEIQVVFEFEYTADDFPTELSLFLNGVYDREAPYADAIWVTPDGREIRLSEFTVGRSYSYRISQDSQVRRRVGNLPPEIGLFRDPSVTDRNVPLKGTYKLVLDGFLFEDESTIEGSLIAYGQVHGIAGTDHRRRDLSVALVWGAPIALTFGLIAAVGTSLITMALSAMAVWFGGFVDWLIRRITEVNMILPPLPILLMIGMFYSRSLWVILGAVVILSIFGSSILTYRSMFLQVKESGYIEAARSYGASSARIIFRYMMPKIIPVLIPGLVVTIPAFVFLEANLAILGLGDPVLPTWGKLLNDAYVQGALYQGHYYWVLEPAFLLMLAGLGFSMLGFALDRVFNPRLRGL